MEVFMQINVIFRLAVLGVIVTVLNIILKQSGKEDIAFFIDLAGVMVVVIWFIPYLNQIFKTLNDMFFKY
jgi:stage III sporulation protein AC